MQIKPRSGEIQEWRKPAVTPTQVMFSAAEYRYGLDWVTGSVEQLTLVSNPEGVHNMVSVTQRFIPVVVGEEMTYPPFLLGLREMIVLRDWLSQRISVFQRGEEVSNVGIIDALKEDDTLRVSTLRRWMVFSQGEWVVFQSVRGHVTEVARTEDEMAAVRALKDDDEED